MENQSVNNSPTQTPTIITPEQVNPANFKPYPRRTRRWREVSAQVRQRGTVLFDQQMWCWGQDIRTCPTNALLKYGFTRHQPPNDPNPRLHNSTSYILEKPGQVKIVLWGFGLLYQKCPADTTALFLGRYDFAPKLVGKPDLELEYLRHWTAATKPHFILPASTEEWSAVRALLPELLGWIIDYEHWVIQNFGLEYRERCVQTWLRPVMPPLKALQEWSWLIAQTSHLGN